MSKPRNIHCTTCAHDMRRVEDRAVDGVYEDAMQICELAKCPRAGTVEQEVEDVPVKRGSDSKGSYFQWGSSGKKYYYQSGSRSSREAAKAKAQKQARAIRASGYKGK